MTKDEGLSVMTVFRFRLRDKHAAVLNRKSRAVNFVWNFCNETQQIAVRRDRKWLTGFDLGRLCSGSSYELGISADTIEEICKQYGRSRQQKKRPWLRFRGRKSLGWVPFKKGTVRLNGQGFIYHGHRYEPMHWREFPEGAVICGGSFSQDAKGHWYINCPVLVPLREPTKPGAVGIDLGLKELATLSTGEKIENPRWFRALEDRLGKAQRARKKRLARNIASKIRNARGDFLHKLSARIAKDHDLIFVGDVSPSKLSRTRMAKSVLDAGWYSFKQQLTYKAIRHGGRCIEVNEAWTSQTCSSCGALPPERPRGIAGLGIRRWTCSACGAEHDRDINAARNIARLGQQSLAEGAAQGGAVNGEG